MATNIDILELMKVLEKTLNDTAAQWRALKDLLEIQKSVNSNQKAPENPKKGRPRKVTK
jgi:hypothetical protein